MNYAQFIKRARMPLGFLLALCYIIFARPSHDRMIPGLAVALCGLIVRAWSAGYIEKNSRLAIAGPYAYVRNPLYLGSFLLAAGFALAWNWLFLLVVIAFFVAIYAPTIEQEKLTMTSLFPDQYPAYAANVPPFVPRYTPWRPGASAVAGDAAPRFSLARYMRHSEWKAALGFAGGCLWLFLRLKLGL